MLNCSFLTNDLLFLKPLFLCSSRKPIKFFFLKFFKEAESFFVLKFLKEADLFFVLRETICSILKPIKFPCSSREPIKFFSRSEVLQGSRLIFCSDSSKKPTNFLFFNEADLFFAFNEADLSVALPYPTVFCYPILSEELISIFRFLILNVATSYLKQNFIWNLQS